MSLGYGQFVASSCGAMNGALMQSPLLQGTVCTGGAGGGYMPSFGGDVAPLMSQFAEQARRQMEAAMMQRPTVEPSRPVTLYCEPFESLVCEPVEFIA